MDSSPPALPQLLTLLLLGFMLSAQAYDQLDYCSPPRICPKFTRTATNQEYEERLYEQTWWICTEGSGTDNQAVIEASIRLTMYLNYQSWANGIEVSEDTWPGLIWAERGAGGLMLSLCWLVPPGVTLSSHGSVTVKTIPQTSMFVRSFGGRPTYQSGQANSRRLMGDLDSNGETFDRTIFYAASYNRHPSMEHHNEIWIPKTPESDPDPATPTSAFAPTDSPTDSPTDAVTGARNDAPSRAPAEAPPSAPFELHCEF